MPTECGELISESEPEPVFDPDLVSVPQGECNVTPLEVEPPAEISLSATVRNPNEKSARATVEWTWLETRLATDEVVIGSNSRETIETQATIERQGRDLVRAEVINVLQLTGRQPTSSMDERVRAGARSVDNGIHRTVAYTGVDARATLARVCGGCAERSRKLTATNRRLRSAFDFVGR